MRGHAQQSSWRRARARQARTAQGPVPSPLFCRTLSDVDLSDTVPFQVPPSWYLRGPASYLPFSVTASEVL